MFYNKHMPDKVLYFGFGANRDPRMIGWVTGRDPNSLRGYHATLEGYGLAVQRLAQIPAVVWPVDSPVKSPREILQEEWGPAFRSYVIYPKPEGKVSGIIWELTPEERDRMADWELVEPGWQEDIEVKVKRIDGEEFSARTERMGAGQRFEHEVDGFHYETWLNDPERFKVVAEKTKQEYDERHEGPHLELVKDINKS